MSNNFTYISTMGNGSWEFDGYTFAAPLKPPYTGTLLPAVIHVFDHDLKSEEFSVFEMQKTLDRIVEELNHLNNAANASCSKLESGNEHLINHIRDLTHTLQDIHAKIQLAKAKQEIERRKQKEPSLEEKSNEPDAELESKDQEATEDAPIVPQQKVEDKEISEHVLKSKRAAEKLEREQLKFKRGAKRIKVLYRKIMMLVHEERVGKNPHLRELYDLAVLARQQDDEAALVGILELAKQYNSKQGKVALLNYFRQKKQALKASAQNAKESLLRLKRAPHMQVHQLLEAGRHADAHSLFVGLLHNQIHHLTVEIQKQNFVLSGHTGEFANQEKRFKIRPDF